MSRIPLPQDRADFNAALIRSTVYGSQGGKVKAHKLIPPYGRETPKRSGKELKEIGMRWAAQADAATKGK